MDKNMIIGQEKHHKSLGFSLSSSWSRMEPRFNTNLLVLQMKDDIWIQSPVCLHLPGCLTTKSPQYSFVDIELSWTEKCI